MYCKIENGKIIHALNNQVDGYDYIALSLNDYVKDPLRIKIIDNKPIDIINTKEYQYAKTLDIFSNSLQQVANKLSEDYQKALDEKFECYDYKAKANFKTKYTKAYIACLDDIEESKEAIVNISIYNSENNLENMDMDFENFKLIYRAVKEKAREIEKIYQQGLAEISGIENTLVSNSPEELISLAPQIEQSIDYLLKNNLFN